MPLPSTELHYAASLAQGKAAALRKKRPSLSNLLDRAIVILMVAILLTLSWPISVVLWHQSRPAQPAVKQATQEAP